MSPTLALALVCLAANAQAAFLTSAGIPPNQETYIEVQFVFADVTEPVNYQVRANVGPYHPSTGGWLDLHLLQTNPVPPPAWEIVPSAWVPKIDRGFHYRPYVTSEYARAELGEFIDAGDELVTFTLDADHEGGGPWHVMAIDSPNLGAVERTFVRVPEPRSAAFVMGFAAFMAWAIREKLRSA